jgi:hypothetical protein
MKKILNLAVTSIVALSANIALAQAPISNEENCKVQLSGIEMALEQKEKGLISPESVKTDMTIAELRALIKSKGHCGALSEVHKRTKE